MKKWGSVYTALALFLYSLNAHAAISNATPDSILSTSSLFNMVLSLFGIVVAIFILSFVLRRYVLPKTALNSAIKILSTMPLGGKDKLILIKADTVFLLLGVTQNSINTLHSFDSFDSLTKSPLNAMKNSNESDSTFSKIQRAILNSKTNHPQA